MDVSKLYARVEEALKKKNFDFAIELLKNQILKVNPNDVKARQLLRASALKKYETAYPSQVAILKKGLVIRIKIIIAQLLKKWDKVMDEAENYLQYDPKNISVLHALGEACAKAKYADSSVAVFENILAFDGNCVKALKALGNVYLADKQDMEKANQCFQRAFKLAPQDIECARQVKDLAAQITSKTYGDAKNSSDLVKDKDKAKELADDQSILRTEDDYKRAIERSLKKLSDDPQNKKELRRVGELYQKLNQLDDAIGIYEKLLQLDATSFDIKCRVSECKIAKSEKRVQDLQEKYQKAPQDQRLKQELQKALQAKIEVEIQEFDMQVKAQPTNCELRFKLGMACFQGNRPDDAIGQFQHAIKDPKFRTQAYIYMGQAFTKKQEFEMAIEQLENAKKLVSAKDTQYRDILYSLGLTYESAKQYQKAIDIFTDIYRVDIGYKDIQNRLKRLKDLLHKS